MKRILLGVTGSVAAIRTPDLVTALLGLDREVRVVATDPALHFFDPVTLSGQSPLYTDVHEWPAQRYQPGDPVLHIAFRDWAEMLIVAPLDANTLAKFALGLNDNFLTCVYRAWDFAKPVVLVPAMNTLMWQSPVTKRHLNQLLIDHGDGKQDPAWPLDEVDDVFVRHAKNVIVIPPIAKRLACGHVGVGAMAEVQEIAEIVRKWHNYGRE